MKKQLRQKETRALKQERSFRSRVHKVVQDIPKGGVLSYGEVARRAGNLGAARAVGQIMSKNHDKNIPCHRVVSSDGKLGGYNGGIEKKKALLKSEGYKV